MSTPSQMSIRRIPEALHLRVRIAYANAWEALIGTHTSQALQFVCEFASRTPVLRALDLYFEVVAVPEGMQESVRTRSLTSLELESLPPLGRAGSSRVGSCCGSIGSSSGSSIAGGIRRRRASSRAWWARAPPRP